MPKEKRASALAFYSMGTPLGGLLGLVMGGLVADAYGWRAAFLVAGAPGILFALLAAYHPEGAAPPDGLPCGPSASGHHHLRRDP